MPSDCHSQVPVMCRSSFQHVPIFHRTFEDVQISQGHRGPVNGSRRGAAGLWRAARPHLQPLSLFSRALLLGQSCWCSGVTGGRRVGSPAQGLPHVEHAISPMLLILAVLPELSARPQAWDILLSPRGEPAKTL